MISLSIFTLEIVTCYTSEFLNIIIVTRANAGGSSKNKRSRIYTGDKCNRSTKGQKIFGKTSEKSVLFFNIQIYYIQFH